MSNYPNRREDILKAFYLPEELKLHCSEQDLWVVIHSRIYNLSAIIEKYRGCDKRLLEPLIKKAGRDISHWFEAETLQVLLAIQIDLIYSKYPISYIDPETTLRLYACPDGPFLGIPETLEERKTTESSFDTDSVDWWKSEEFLVGYLTSEVQTIRVLNTLTGRSAILRICSEWTIDEISRHFSKILNSHSRSYTWKYLGRELDMSRDLGENKVKNHQKELIELNVEIDHKMFENSVTTLELYFNDDLTVK
ncbi:MAG: Cytochrome b5 domain-containing protein 1 [Marteilia pararefringens]